LKEYQISFSSYQIDIQNDHGVIAEEVYDFDSDFKPAGGYFAKDRFEFEETIFFGEEFISFEIEVNVQ
jgi:hypothetical protein